MLRTSRHKKISYQRVLWTVTLIAYPHHETRTCNHQGGSLPFRNLLYQKGLLSARVRSKKHELSHDNRRISENPRTRQRADQRGQGVRRSAGQAVRTELPGRVRSGSNQSERKNLMPALVNTIYGVYFLDILIFCGYTYCTAKRKGVNVYE